MMPSLTPWMTNEWESALAEMSSLSMTLRRSPLSPLRWMGAPLFENVHLRCHEDVPSAVVVFIP